MGAVSQRICQESAGGAAGLKFRFLVWLVLSFSFFYNPFWERLPQLTNIFEKVLNLQLVVVFFLSGVGPASFWF